MTDPDESEYSHEEKNTVVKKAQLIAPSIDIRTEILVQFYRSVVESIMALSLCVWFGSISQRSRLDRVVKSASKIVGDLAALTAKYNDISKNLLAILFLIRLSPLNIRSNYYRQASV